jgi:hypothetical protein
MDDSQIRHVCGRSSSSAAHAGTQERLAVGKKWAPAIQQSSYHVKIVPKALWELML